MNDSLRSCYEFLKENSQDYLKGEYDRALENQNYLLTILDNLKEKESSQKIIEVKLEAYTLMCNILEMKKEYDKTATYLKKIEEEIIKAKDADLKEKGKITSLIISGRINTMTGEVDEGIKNANEVLDLCKGNPLKKKEEATAYYIRGTCLIGKGKPSEIEEDLKKSIILFN